VERAKRFLELIERIYAESLGSNLNGASFRLRRTFSQSEKPFSIFDMAGAGFVQDLAQKKKAPIQKIKK
jgi:hypothetical protein